MSETYKEFLDIWHMIAFYGSFGLLGVSILMYIIYKVRYVAAGSLKAKYDFVSTNEVKWYQWSHFIFAIAVFLFLNQIRQETMALSSVWFFIRLFTAFCLGILYGYVAFLVFKYYYPKPLNKKLKHLRYTPRVNPNNGNQMKLLSEEEEDAYLDEGMQAEEDAFSVDYDVWIDSDTEYVQIEKYKGHLTALECDRCGFQTLKLSKEEILKHPSEYADGEIKKEYECTYCGRIKRQTVRLSRTSTPELDKMGDNMLIDDPLKTTTVPVSVKVEVLSNRGQIKNYEFQNTKEASKFLEEFDFAKLDEE
ncbi:MAG: hypothetical protein NXI20_18110 [bacterium]|nr:hypothetical protein [bacterium]